MLGIFELVIPFLCISESFFELQKSDCNLFWCLFCFVLFLGGFPHLEIPNILFVISLRGLK